MRLSLAMNFLNYLLSLVSYTGIWQLDEAHYEALSFVFKFSMRIAYGGNNQLLYDYLWLTAVAYI